MAVQQHEVGEQLAEAWRLGDGVVRHQLAGDGGADEGECKRGKVGRDQLEKTLAEQLSERAGNERPVAGQALRGQEAADDEEGLHRDAGVLRQPGEEFGRQRRGVVGHRAVEGQVMQDDDLGDDRLEGVDEGVAGFGAHVEAGWGGL